MIRSMTTAKNLTITCLALLAVVLMTGTPAALARQDQPATQPAAPVTGWLGAKLMTVDEMVAEERGLDATEGVLADEVLPGSPAEAGGMKSGDVITKMDTTAIKELPDLQKMMRASKPGQVMAFTVMRGKETVELKVTLGNRPANIPSVPATRPG